MADVGESIRALLLADASVAAQVGTRIVPDVLAQGEALPAIPYRVISTRHEQMITGTKVGILSSRITLDCFATTRAAANALAELVRLSGLLDWSGATYGVDVLAVQVDTGAAYEHEPNTEGSHELRYITSQDYAITFRESV